MSGRHATAVDAVRFVSVVFTAVAMSAGLAHLFSLPNKIALPAEAYLTVQQIYRGWALLAIAVIGALASTLVLTVMVRHTPGVFGLTLLATLCIALSLAVFFTFTYPANEQTLNWTVLPDGWQALRRRWEYSHAAGAGLYFVAFVSLVLAMLRRPRG